MLTLAPIFTDHAVLQRRKPIPVWGTAAPGKDVTVRLGGDGQTVTAGPDGRWLAALPPREAGTEEVLAVSCGGETLTRRDLCLGEVWLAGGQSNMELPLAESRGGSKAIAGSGTSNVRFFRVPREGEETAWQRCAPETSGVLSAAAYHFARQVAEAQRVAVGIISCCYGGTSISCWMSRERLAQSVPGQRYLDDYGEAAGGKTDGEYRREMARYHPFLALCEHTATQGSGLVYGMSLVYSGNFLAQAELDQFNRARVVMGIHPDGFSWHLDPGESFQTPEAVLVCSHTGLGGMSRTFHDLFRGHLIRGQHKPRPVLLNSWEACYFDFDHDKLLEMGREAAQRGIELLVVDDGWFGRRNDTASSLGDWRVNEEKLPGGLRRLGDELAALGVQLGVWMEPEMVSPDSELYQAHPDWAMAIPGRAPALARDQLVLDLTRREVRECVWEQIAAVLNSAPITYLKWDMNRPLTDLYSAGLPPERQGEVYHRYVLGLYELQERLVSQFPNLLLENCCSGGGRFDPGMLYYSPQIWTSDNAEAIDRLVIQEGMSLIYPYSTMGAHIAACPSHVNGRTTPFETRGRASLPGCFGYELDLGKLTQAERSAIPQQIEEYRQYSPVFHDGDCYRLASYRENHSYDAVMAVSKDKSLAVVNFVQVRSRACRRSLRLPLAGLDETACYRDKASNAVLTGAGWMNGGLLIEDRQSDFYSKLVVLERVCSQRTAYTP